MGDLLWQPFEEIWLPGFLQLVENQRIMILTCAPGYTDFYKLVMLFPEIPASSVPSTPPVNSPAKPETRQMVSIMTSAWNRSSARSSVSVS